MNDSAEYCFEWFDFATASTMEMQDIKDVYAHVFERDIGITFDPTLDTDFIQPLTYYSAANRGAFGVIREKSLNLQDNDGAKSGKIVGTVGIRQVVPPPEFSLEIADQKLRAEDGVCELKRMFLLPCARGRRLAQVMIDKCLGAAKETLGYRWMVLDTKKKLTAANLVYEKNGFVDCGNYNGNPRADRFMAKLLV